MGEVLSICLEKYNTELVGGEPLTFWSHIFGTFGINKCPWSHCKGGCGTWIEAKCEMVQDFSSMSPTCGTLQWQLHKPWALPASLTTNTADQLQGRGTWVVCTLSVPMPHTYPSKWQGLHFIPRDTDCGRAAHVSSPSISRFLVSLTWLGSKA